MASKNSHTLHIFLDLNIRENSEWVVEPVNPNKMLDNKGNEKVCDELIVNIRTGSSLYVISAYFTIYAFNEPRDELEKIDSMKFIFS